jgi:peptidoglycan/LPS O-acetylase OafA/YrhL
MHAASGAPHPDIPPALREGLSSSHLPGLDGLRAVAVGLVVLYHLGFQWVPGGHGVLVFFVLSGFLITWLLLRERERTGSISLRRFYLRRALRILPAFYCFWFGWTALVLLFDRPVVWGQALSSFVFLNNYYQAAHGDPNTGYSHTWSLGIEEQFYLLWPVSLVVMGRRPRRIAAALAALIGFVWVYRVFLHFGLGVDQGYIYEAFETRADHLAMGCLLAVLLRQGRPRRGWAALSTSWSSILTVALFIVSANLSHHLGTGYRNVMGFALDPLLVAILIAQVIALRDSPLWRWLNWRWVAYLGTLSYSIYLYQQVVIGPVRSAFASYPLPVELAAALAAVLLAAGASYHFVERLFVRIKGRTSPRSAGRSIAAPVRAAPLPPRSVSVAGGHRGAP